MKQWIRTGSPLAALLLMGSCFADQNQTTPKQSKIVPGYNAPNRVNVGRSWDFYAQGSFIYWQPTQDNMEPGVVSEKPTLTTEISGSVINFNTDYKPGFQAEIGIQSSYDNWDSCFQYTQFHSTQKTHKVLDSSGNPVIFQTWLAPNGNLFSSVHEKWHLGMDFLDWQLGRDYFIGKKLSFRPFFALRAAWIEQKVKVDYLNASNGYNRFYEGSSHSWAIGPKGGIHSKWNIGANFRIFANVDGDILYTQYTKLTANESEVNSKKESIPKRLIDQKNLNTVRSHAQGELGLGWCHYFSHHKWRLDLSAGYNFQVFPDQNMFRKFVDDVDQAISISPNGNLHIQGLTVSARLDF